MSDQARALRGLIDRFHSQQQHRAAGESASTSVRTIAVTSGKGGVGKSNIALNLSIALAEIGHSVCLLDANLGLGNIDLLCGLNGYWNLSHVITGARTLEEIMLQGPGGIDVIPGASGLAEIADCAEGVRRDLFQQLLPIEQSHDFLVLDTGTGIHRQVRQFVSAADVALIVTTPEPTSMADAYATVKSLAGIEDMEPAVLVNQAQSAEQADAVIDRIRQTSKLFVHQPVTSAGFIPHDPAVTAAVAARTPFLIQSPHTAASAAIQRLARQLSRPATGQRRSAGFLPRIWERTIGQLC